MVGRFTNVIMKDGKKSTAEHIVYGAFEVIESKTRQVPVEVRPERATSLAMRWLADYARARAGKSTREKLADEIIDAANERGEAVKKREDTHRMAEANKAFSHYRW
jgi:small subunit ribosomal protein S7